LSQTIDSQEQRPVGNKGYMQKGVW